MPLYQQLRDRIESGDLEIGDLVPTTQELAKAAGISERTARTAVMHLQDDGFVLRRSGHGTVVVSVNPRPAVTGTDAALEQRVAALESEVGTHRQQLAALEKRLRRLRAAFQSDD